MVFCISSKDLWKEQAFIFRFFAELLPLVTDVLKRQEIYIIIIYFQPLSCDIQDGSGNCAVRKTTKCCLVHSMLCYNSFHELLYNVSAVLESFFFIKFH